MSDIFVVKDRISTEILSSLAERRFGDMVKGVVDISSGVVALGAELHADEEALLLQQDSLQDDLWGFNIYMDEDFPENIEFDSMINIRPRQNNNSRTVESPEIRAQILKILEMILPV